MTVINKFWLEPIQGYNPWKDSENFIFDEKLAEKICDLFPKIFSHSKGEFCGVPFDLFPDQRKIIGHLFGWKREDDTRRYRELFKYIPKKNGKTQLAAAIALLLLAFDNEPGAEVYCASGDTDQASILYGAAEDMVNNNKILDDNIKILPGYKLLKYSATNSYLKVLSSEAKTKHGPNVHGLILDEIHIFPNRELIDTLQRGTVMRRQPLTLYLTTADYARPSVCNSMLSYAKKVRDGEVKNPYYMPVIYEANMDDDWASEGVWKRVNPGYGITVKKDYFLSEVQKAKDDPTLENSFKRLHLNIQTKQENRWLSMLDWDNSGDKNFDIDLLRGCKCYLGIDLSSAIDITAIGLFFPDHKAFLCKFFVPKGTADKRIEYEMWAKDGYIDIIGGPVIDDDAIIKTIKDLDDIYDIEFIAYDPWGATKIANKLSNREGYTMFEFRQGYKSMNEPTRELYKFIVNRMLTHFDNPVLRWMATNANVKEQDGNVKLVKPNKDSPLKIDGIIVLVMCFGVWIANKIDDGGFLDCDDDKINDLIKEIYG